MLIKQPFDEFLKFHYERISDSKMKVTLPIQPLFINSAGLVHGGIISTLADVAMGNIFEPDENQKQSVVTADLKVSFLKGATGEYLVADAHLVKRGRTLSHTDCLIFNDQNQVVAKASGIFASI
ncbi:PaaI family thioesterase [Cytobacillus firmus]|uniref:PaaI family thioesterase n=1 Tax=Cytobacillus firmus TaxID=1399 RepID=UPI001CFC603C|nr:PaaI family thioesterase [Cytobacillus firmus]URT71332.1 PaaI family thioesterase [Cytobacillus firmus]WHY62243.1 PaaI family thioesterase [Cytobacillus firmus]